MIVSLCAQQLSEYEFSVWNVTSTQTFENAGIDILTGVTAATLHFQKVNGEGDDVTVDIIDQWQYLFETGGITINFADFGESEINGFTYFPDWLYTVTINYTYDGEEYEAAVTVGFVKIIKNIVYQQMMQANWKKELSCSCGCDPYNTTLRKWNFLMMLDIAATLCLISEYEYTLLALYKLTGTEHEFN